MVLEQERQAEVTYQAALRSATWAHFQSKTDTTGRLALELADLETIRHVARQITPAHYGHTTRARPRGHHRRSDRDRVHDRKRDRDLAHVIYRQLGNYLVSHPSVRSLRLTDWEITASLVQALAQPRRHTGTEQDRVRMEDESLQDPARHGFHAIREVTFCSNNLGMNPASLSTLVTALLQCDVLESVAFLRNSLTDTHVAPILELLEQARGLKHLSLCWNGIGDTGSSQIAHTLMSLTPALVLESLDLSCNRITAKGTCSTDFLRAQQARLDYHNRKTRQTSPRAGRLQITLDIPLPALPAARSNRLPTCLASLSTSSASVSLDGSELDEDFVTPSDLASRTPGFDSRVHTYAQEPSRSHGRHEQRRQSMQRLTLTPVGNYLPGPVSGMCGMARDQSLHPCSTLSSGGGESDHGPREEFMHPQHLHGFAAYTPSLLYAC
jgi:hypothetical protein